MEIELEKKERKVKIGNEEVIIGERLFVDLERLKPLLKADEPLEDQLAKMGYKQEHIEKIRQALDVSR